MAILSIGEMLIDFIGTEKASIDKVSAFKKEAGGCVANVACVASKLGHKSYLLTSLGQDGFGDFLENILEKENVDTKYVSRRSFTPLAFVALDESGDRSFSFYFKGSSALSISKQDIESVDLSEIKAIHFASIAIQEESKESHMLLMKKAKEKGILISFDVNLRFNLWDSKEEYLKTIKEFLPYVDVIKVADNELEFLTGTTDIKEALNNDLSHIKFVLYTKGGDGAEVYNKSNVVLKKVPKVEVIDTTGAGDAFAGSFLSQLLKVADIDNVSIEELEELATFSTNYASFTTTRTGAISSYVTREELAHYMK
ncbi:MULTISPECIES: carbohydrate kinase [unclassified Gemella]|uniref:carbohydrate kinase family protein n=1 Tax=unclassified Gemella TaxID=2624949 RepID=UPI0010749C85|nr:MULTISPECIES: carbohydrate kinase [unclassified Gemella]MBF0709706.1 carbohydrate kinase [Gemella sp. GL1.1]MBF0746876.1 carbohydrate kinase [Gemella sp. 19428wG2_WT2a]NYS27050.1 carbohydrate kinase [Gemella sp. GL1]TFU59106.1 carbohydrate kinase [Gemella sp. WT2a]